MDRVPQNFLDGSRTPVRRMRRVHLSSALLRRLARRADTFETELDALPAFVSPGDTCLDIGAKHGAYTLVMADAAGANGRVIAFEPLPGPGRIIRAGRWALGGTVVTLVPAAVAAAGGRGLIGLPVRRGIPVPGRAFLTSQATGPGSNAGWRHRLLEVRLVDLDGWWLENGSPPIAVVKIDVEGAEKLVLDGAHRLIGHERPTLLVELEDHHLERFGTTAQSILDSLIAVGYRAAVLDEGHWEEVTVPNPRIRNHLFTHCDTAR